MAIITNFYRTPFLYMAGNYVFKPKTALLLLVLCGFLVYGNSIGNDFNLDDSYYTAGNSLTANGIAAIPDLLTQPTIYGARGVGYDYRPVTAVSFALQHQFLGDSAGVGHFINVLLYIVTVLLMFALLRRWIRSDYATALAFWISLLFLVHPLHTEVVASIKSRDELLALLFVLLSMWCAAQFFEQKKWYGALLAPLCFALALFSKYTVVPYMVLIPLSLYFFSRVSVPKTVLTFLALLALALCCHWIKTSILPPFDRLFSISENALAAEEYGIGHRVATSLYVTGRYLWLHLFPFRLTVYYGYAYVPVVSWANIGVWASLLVHALLAWVCVRQWFKSPLLVFGLLVYGVHMAAFSNLLDLAPGMMAERFTYSSTWGVCIAVVWVLYAYRDALRRRFHLSQPLVLAGLLALVFGARTIVRNKDWKNKEVLYAHDVQVAGNSAMVNYLYGDWLLSSALEQKKSALANRVQNPWINQQISERISTSQTYFNKVLQVNARDTMALYGLASGYIQLDDHARAEQVLKETVALYPRYVEAHFTLGLTHVYQREYREAVGRFQEVVRLDPGFVLAYEQLNRAQLEMGDTTAALATLEQAIRANPSSPVPYAEKANYYLQVKDTVRAVTYAEKAAALPPKNTGVVVFLRDYFSRTGNGAKASFYQQQLDGTF